MPWTLTPDAGEFLRRAGDHLAADRVSNAPLLAEGAYLAGAAAPGVSGTSGALFGWWTAADGAAIEGGFVLAPGHAPLLSAMPPAALAELVSQLPSVTGLGVPETMVADAVGAWADAGVGLVVRRSFTVYRLERLPLPPATDGRARIATAADRALLHGWYDELMARHPGDPSERRYIVDDPLSFGGIVLWEVAGVPVAMCGRSRATADTVRLGPCFAPGADHGSYSDAAFSAGAAAARAVAGTVVVLAAASDADEAARLAGLGFGPAATRVALGGPEI